MNLFIHTQYNRFVAAIVAVFAFSEFGVQVRFHVAVVEIRVYRIVKGVDFLFRFLLVGLRGYEVGWIEVTVSRGLGIMRSIEIRIDIRRGCVSQ